MSEFSTAAFLHTILTPPLSLTMKFLTPSHITDTIFFVKKTKSPVETRLNSGLVINIFSSCLYQIELKLQRNNVLKKKQRRKVSKIQASAGNDRIGCRFTTTQAESNSLSVGVIPAGDGSLIYLPAHWTSHRKLNS
jgi:hypothetical protein